MFTITYLTTKGRRMTKDMETSYDTVLWTARSLKAKGYRQIVISRTLSGAHIATL